MDESEARLRLQAALEDALKAYREISAVEGRARAAHGAFSYLMGIGIETRLLAPLVELATQNQYERLNRKGRTTSAPETFRFVAGSIAISAILERAPMGRSLKQIAKVVAKSLGGVEADHLIGYRNELMAGRKSRDATALYKEFSEERMKPVFDAYPQGGQDLEKFVLLLIKGLAPVEAKL